MTDIQLDPRNMLDLVNASRVEDYTASRCYSPGERHRVRQLDGAKQIREYVIHLNGSIKAAPFEIVAKALYLSGACSSEEKALDVVDLFDGKKLRTSRFTGISFQLTFDANGRSSYNISKCLMNPIE